MIVNQKLKKSLFFKMFSCGLIFYSFSGYAETLSLKDLRQIANQTNWVYQQYLQKQMQLYIRNQLDLPQRLCQRDDQTFGCTTYQKQKNTWSIQLTLKEALRVKALDFGQLWLLRQGNGQRKLVAKNQSNQSLEFSFDGPSLSGWQVKNKQRTLTNRQLEALKQDAAFIYRDQLKRAMIQYQNQQIAYPTDPCDARMLRLGCVSFSRFQHHTQMTIVLSKEKKQTFLGFHSLLYKRQNDGSGMIQFRDSQQFNESQQSQIFIPIVNDQMQSLHTLVNQTFDSWDD